MENDDWKMMREIFEQATRLAVDDRPAFLDRACGDDDALLNEVRSLLLSHDRSDSFLETPAGDLILEGTNADAPKLTRGERLGNYEIVGVIGSGGMGDVYLATDQKLGRNVAVKVLSSKLAGNESDIQRFVREAKAASALNHPNILVIHEFGETEDAHFIVSEFVDGNTLRELMKAGALPIAKAVQIATQTANALSAAHQADLVHRDIKPENIMVRPDGYVKVLDFGLAKLVERSEDSHTQVASAAAPSQPVDIAQNHTLANRTATGMIMGTLNYMSPEQALGGEVDARTDIFSFGAMLYEVLTGRTPFAGPTVTDTIDNLMQATPRRVSEFNDVPGKLDRLVMKCLEKDRESRYRTMQEVLSDLGSLSDSPELKRGTSNEEAYWLYLQGKNLIATHFPTDACAAIEYFDKAVDLDPAFARAFACRAQALFIASHGGGGSQKEMNEAAKLSATRALELDPALGEAHAVFGEIAFTHDWNLREAERYLRRSVELEPSSELGHAVYGEYLATRSRFDEAVAEIKTALEIDPKSCANQIIYGRILYFARRYDEAIVQFKRVIEVFPSWTTAYGWIWLTYEIKGDVQNAFEWLIRNQEQNSVTPERIAAYAEAWTAHGWRGVGEKLIEFERPDGPGGNFYALARHAIRIGDHDLALDYLERSYEAHQYQITWLAVDPFFDPVRTDPSFDVLLDKAGLQAHL